MSDAAGLAPRALLQRQRVLDAAERCFVASGFHAASIADIAAEARMSPGLIYRYFKNKNAIVKGIIDRRLQERCRAIEDLDDSGGMLRALLQAFDCWRRMDNPKMNVALFLEMTAAATRDAEIAKLTRTADEFVRNGLQQTVQRIASAHGVVLSGAALRSRTLILQCLIEGLSTRAVHQPKINRVVLEAALERVIAAVVTA